VGRRLYPAGTSRGFESRVSPSVSATAAAVRYCGSMELWATDSRSDNFDCVSKQEHLGDDRKIPPGTNKAEHCLRSRRSEACLVAGQALDDARLQVGRIPNHDWRLGVDPAHRLEDHIFLGQER